jgi:hypothetical protein
MQWYLTKETGSMGREIESHRGIVHMVALKTKQIFAFKNKFSTNSDNNIIFLLGYVTCQIANLH